MSQKRIDLIFSILIAILLAWIILEARGWPPRTRLFPWSIGFVAWGLSLVRVGFAIRDVLRPQHKLKTGDRTGFEPDRGATFEETEAPAEQLSIKSAIERSPAEVNDGVVRDRIASISAWVIAFFFGIWFLGFKVGSLLLTFAFLKFGAKEHWKVSAVFGISTYLFFLIVFDFALAISLPPGLIAESLGLRSLDSYIVHLILDTILD